MDRCIDGRLFRHRPFPDDPDFEHDIGECPQCRGAGCCKDGDVRCDACDNGIDTKWPFCAWCGVPLAELDQADRAKIDEAWKQHAAARPPAPPASPPDREAYWLCERAGTYATGAHTNMPAWSTDVWRAARFTSFAAAEEYRLCLMSPTRDEARSVEHLFINRRPPEMGNIAEPAAPAPSGGNSEVAAHELRRDADWLDKHGHFPGMALRMRGSANDIDTLRAALAEARAEVARLRLALEPFAKAAEKWNDVPGTFTSPDVQLWQNGEPVDYITVGDLRNARAAVNATPPAPAAAREADLLPGLRRALIVVEQGYVQRHGPGNWNTVVVHDIENEISRLSRAEGRP